MTKEITFSVEDRVYTIPANFAELSSFTVQSCPRPYPVVWDEGKPQNKLIEIFNENPKNILIIDKNVFNLYFKDSGLDEQRIYKVEAVEANKNMETVLDFVSFLEKQGFTKGEKLLAAGGGIVEDIAAFAGASYKRGIHWEFFPTTLLSMCDSCIGGKTGINYNNVKNQMALFSAPRRVIINTEFLKTLHPREIKSGLGEILKLLVTGGEKLVAMYENLVKNGEVSDFNNFRPLILGALWVKKAIIEDDEFELNIRKSLNYGHTIGHAIEVLTHYEIPHGQAVALGMIVVDKLSSNRGLLKEESRRRLLKPAKELLNPQMTALINTDGLLDLIHKDKKTLGNVTNFVIIEAPGITKFLKLELNRETLSELNNIIDTEIK